MPRHFQLCAAALDSFCSQHNIEKLLASKISPYRLTASRRNELSSRKGRHFDRFVETMAAAVSAGDLLKGTGTAVNAALFSSLSSFFEAPQKSQGQAFDRFVKTMAEAAFAGDLLKGSSMTVHALFSSLTSITSFLAALFPFLCP